MCMSGLCYALKWDAKLHFPKPEKQQEKFEISTFASASFDIVNMSDFPINWLWTQIISCLLLLQVLCEVFLVSEL